jgi:DNA modification methylase
MVEPYYEQDGITIYCGDCREILPKVEFDLVVSDPPYGIALSNHDTSGKYRRDRDWTISNDHDTEAADWVIEHSRTRDVALVVFASPDKPYAGKWRNRLVWHKDGLGMGGDPKTCWRRDWELILVDGTNQLNGGRDSAVLRYTIRPDQFWHPCQKPVALLEYLIGKIPANVVCDPFMGSGTTLRAAANHGRSAIGIEIEEKYCEMAAKRLAQGVLF